MTFPANSARDNSARLRPSNNLETSRIGVLKPIDRATTADIHRTEKFTISK